MTMLIATIGVRVGTGVGGDEGELLGELLEPGAGVGWGEVGTIGASLTEGALEDNEDAKMTAPIVAPIPTKISTKRPAYTNGLMRGRFTSTGCAVSADACAWSGGTIMMFAWISRGCSRACTEAAPDRGETCGSPPRTTAMMGSVMANIVVRM